MGLYSSLFRMKPGTSEMSGQVTTEYMLVLWILTCLLIVGFFLVVPGMREGFLGLAEKIISEKP